MNNIDLHLEFEHDSITSLLRLILLSGPYVHQLSKVIESDTIHINLINDNITIETFDRVLVLLKRLKYFEFLQKLYQIVNESSIPQQIPTKVPNNFIIEPS